MSEQSDGAFALSVGCDPVQVALARVRLESVFTEQRDRLPESRKTRRPERSAGQSIGSD